ncbi:thiol-disulfide oxidoreductase DCC family protein [Lentimicrobium sp. S6]|uniref:thiol-disulfide oxidoreductase DCC family protein n=1 Tax=Lentimicrobium sp. S6 TaxID=2735872 RepID=UPI0015579178|nr:DCC1-like thiol-disulfide oxidoreductase family protein [Lentimicrobium sp. S6]NPD44193.1 DUF393 domain-containing protein [Lentimicrobium sp. S6]
MNTKHSHIILYDGVCKLCHASFNFIIHRDSKAIFRFQALQDFKNFELLESQIQKPIPDSILYIQEGKIFTKSTAALKICKNLDGLWPVFYVFIMLPRPIRDYIYDLIAKYRYSWFGKYNTCMIPDENLIDRFI